MGRRIYKCVDLILIIVLISSLYILIKINWQTQ